MFLTDRNPSIIFKIKIVPSLNFIWQRKNIQTELKGQKQGDSLETRKPAAFHDKQIKPGLAQCYLW